MEKTINKWIKYFIDQNIINSNEVYETFKIYIEEDKEQKSCLSLKKMIEISKSKETILPLKEIIIFINLFYDFEDYIKHIDTDKDFYESLTVFSKYKDYFEKTDLFFNVTRLLYSLDTNKALFLIKTILSSFSEINDFENFFIKYIKDEDIKNNVLITMIEKINDIDKNEKILNFLIELNDKKILEILLSKTNENYIKILDNYLKIVKFKVVENANTFNIVLYNDKVLNDFVKSTQDILKKEKNFYCYKKNGMYFREEKSKFKVLTSYNLCHLLSGENYHLIQGLKISGKKFFISRKKIENEITKKPYRIKKLLKIIENNEYQTKTQIQCCEHYIWASSYLDYNNLNLYSFLSKIIFDFLGENKEHIKNVLYFIEKSNSISAKSLLVTFLHKQKSPELKDLCSFLNTYRHYDKERFLYTPSCLDFLFYNIFQYENFKTSCSFGNPLFDGYFDKNRLIEMNLDEVKNKTKETKLILNSLKKLDKEKKNYPKNKLKSLFFNNKELFFAILNENIKNLNVLNLIHMFKILNKNGITRFTNYETKVISNKLIKLRKKEDAFNILICLLEFNDQQSAEKLIRLLKAEKKIKIKIKYDLIENKDFFFVLNSIRKLESFPLKQKDFCEIEQRAFKKDINRRQIEEFLIFMLNIEENKTINLLKKLNDKGFLTNRQFYNICKIDIHNLNLQQYNNCIVVNGNNNNVIGNIIN